MSMVRGDQGMAHAVPLIVIGAGGHAAVLVHTLGLLKRRVLFATDSNPDRHGTSLDGVEIRGGDALVLEFPPDQVELVNGIGSTRVPEGRRAAFQRFREAGYRFASVLHPSAVIAPTARLGEGVQVMAGAVVQHGASIGDDALVNTRASIDHHCVIGSHVHVAPGVTVCGNVRIGEATHVGAGATIVQGVQVGDAVVIGAGSVVVRPVPSGEVVVGVPARPHVETAASHETL
jgi:sugar O-acyltransferase (sialic acid O-acetyltransferase NeuD family)